MRRTALNTIVALLTGVASASGQALLPPKGEAYASVLFTNVFVKNHFLPAHPVDIGHIDTNVTLFDLTYGLTDRMAVTVGLPLVVSRYKGAFPHQPTNPEGPDNGEWNTNFQDLRFNVRYNLVKGPVAVTPYIGSVMPSNGYDFLAHSAPGRQLTEVQVGLSAATLLDQITPGLFLQARYGFAFMEKTLDVRPNNSNVDVELGYFLSPTIRVFGMAAGHYSHDGIDLPIPPIARVTLTPEQLTHHDQIVQEHYFNLGVGTSITLTESLDLYGSFVKQMAGRNTHQIDRALSMGVSWRFKRGRTEDLSAVTAPPAQVADRSARKSLVRCLCQKTAS